MALWANGRTTGKTRRPAYNRKRWLGREAGLHHINARLHDGFNYKKERPDQALPRLVPDGIDIYFDNVGGEHLEAALCSMKDFGRVIMCGTIAEYNNEREAQYPLRAYSHIFSKRLTVRGFIVSDSDIAPKYAKRTSGPGAEMDQRGGYPCKDVGGGGN